MKVDKFDYSRKKEIIISVINDLDDNQEINASSSFSNSFKHTLKEVKEDIKLIEIELKKQNIDITYEN